MLIISIEMIDINSKLIFRKSQNISFIFLNVLLGISILKNIWALGIVCLILICLIERQLLNKSLRSYFIVIYLGYLTIPLVTMLWFIKITASGWSSRIWNISPHIWLFVALFVCIAISTIMAILPRLFLYRISLSKKLQSLLYIISWPLCMLLFEIIFSYSFSLLTRGNGVPLAPSWNFISASLLIPATSYFGNVLSVMGFWGSSYYIFLCTVIVSSVIRYFYFSKNKKTKHLYVLLLTLLILLSFPFINNVVGLQTEYMNTRIIATRASKTDNRYLENVVNSVHKSNSENNIVVLPEYSDLLRPFPSGVIDTNNKDYRDQIKDAAKNKNLAIVGTEDRYSSGQRYVETYVLDSNLDRSASRQKEFLVPGGEYIVPWIGWIMERLDSRSLSSFYKERGKSVLPIQPVQSNSETSSKIVMSPCSTILTPYALRTQVKNGGRMIAYNVSFAQFPNAPEYEMYSKRFAAFAAKSLGVPIVTSSVEGDTYVMNKDGRYLEQSNYDFIDKEINLASRHTIYAEIGDGGIIIMIIMLSISIYLALFTRHILTKRKPSDKDR